MSEKTPSSDAAAEAYRARFLRLIAYVDAHLDEELGLERSSAFVACSKFHFQRQFAHLFGISLHQYVALQRLKRAAYQLAFRDEDRVIEIALASGYEGPEAFARAFKKHLGQSPSDFRKQPEWRAWAAAYQPLMDMKVLHMTPEIQLAEVQVVDFPETRIAVLEHHGDAALLGDSIRQFIAWRKQNHLPPSVSATFNLVYNDPATTEPSDFRLDLCAEVDHPVPASSLGIVNKAIPAGRCARLRHVGSDVLLGKSAAFLYAEWLPQSGETPRDFPLFFQRVRFFPDVPEHEAIVDIFLPLK